MRILLIHQYFLEDNAAGGSRWNEMARIWTQEGHTVTVIAGSTHYMTNVRDARRFLVKTNKDGVLIIRCPACSGRLRGFPGRFFEYFSFALSAIYAGLRFTRDRYDCILVTSPPLLVGIPGLLLAQCKRIPLMVEIRDLWPESAIEMGVLANPWLIKLAHRFEKYLYQKASLINVLTPAFRDRLISKAVTPKKIIHIPNAADFRWIAGKSTSRDDLGLGEKFVIIYVGAHGLANDLVQLIEAAELLRDTPAHFLLIGDGMQKPMLMEQVKSRALTNVTFLDPVPKEKIFEYILMADAGVAVLKKAEIFKTVYSNKTFDYLSCQKPVIMAIDGISRQLVEQAEAGRFVEPGNAQALAAAVRFYIQNPALVKQHGVNGYHFVKAHFDREKLARQYLQALQAHLFQTG